MTNLLISLFYRVLVNHFNESRIFCILHIKKKGQRVFSYIREGLLFYVGSQIRFQ